jgi:hypothetical protein
MASPYMLDQFLMEMPCEYDYETMNQLEYQPMPDSCLFENLNNSNRSTILHTATSSISPLNFMMWTENYLHPTAELAHLFSERNEYQIPFSHGWSEGQTGYGDLEPGIVRPDIYSPSQPLWAADNLQSGGIFNDFPPQSAFPEAYHHTPVMPPYNNYPTPASTPYSATNSQSSCFNESAGMPERSRSTPSPRSNAVYICDICAKPHSKRHLLKYVRPHTTVQEPQAC